MYCMYIYLFRCKSVSAYFYRTSFESLCLPATKIANTEWDASCAIFFCPSHTANRPPCRCASSAAPVCTGLQSFCESVLDKESWSAATLSILFHHFSWYVHVANKCDILFHLWSGLFVLPFQCDIYYLGWWNLCAALNLFDYWWCQFSSPFIVSEAYAAHYVLQYCAMGAESLFIYRNTDHRFYCVLHGRIRDKFVVSPHVSNILILSMIGGRKCPLSCSCMLLPVCSLDSTFFAHISPLKIVWKVS